MAEVTAHDIARRKSLIKILIAVPIVILFIIFAYQYLQKVRVHEPGKVFVPAGVGVQAPDFTFPDLSGNQVTLSKLKGKVIFLNVWATWCPTCVWEMPSMEKLFQRYKGKNFEMLAVSIDILGAQVVEPFMKKYNLSFPALLDTKRKIWKPYGLTGVPETFIIDKNGSIVHKQIGSIDWAQDAVYRFFDQLINKG